MLLPVNRIFTLLFLLCVNGLQAKSPNVADYFKLSHVLACGDSWMAKPSDWVETHALHDRGIEIDS
jgi:2-keto-3-deoxy-6-phosphogluconate aldolase